MGREIDTESPKHVAAGAAGGGGGGGNLHRGGRNAMNHVISGLAADALLKNSEFTSIFVCNF